MFDLAPGTKQKKNVDDERKNKNGHIFFFSDHLSRFLLLLSKKSLRYQIAKNVNFSCDSEPMAGAEWKMYESSQCRAEEPKQKYVDIFISY